MNIDETYRLIQFIARKSQHGNNPSPAEFNLIIDRANTEWVKDNIGNKNQYTSQGGSPTVSFDKNIVIKDDLRHLIEKREFDVDASGMVKIPDGLTVLDSSGNIAKEYIHLSSVRNKYVISCNGNYETKEKSVKILRDDEIGNALSSRITSPTMDFPVMAVYDNHFQFYPQNIKRVTITYLRKSRKPFWESTIGTGRPVYDPIGSSDLESPDHTHNDIVMRALRYIGISIRESSLFNYANQMEKEGI